MENYREKLKKQNILLSVCIAILAVFSVLGFAAEAGLLPVTATGIPSGAASSAVPPWAFWP